LLKEIRPFSSKLAFNNPASGMHDSSPFPREMTWQ